VLLTFGPDRDVELRELEEVNGLEWADILQARWIKLVSRSASSQISGHAIFSLTFPQVTSEILVNRLFICHEKVYAKRCKKVS